VTAELPAAAPIVQGDARRLKQIALNLLSNAMKFTPAGGAVQVSLSFGDDGVALVVADTGIGMTPQQIPIALEPFGQVDSSLSRRHEGTGLGLPLCRRFAEAHGGSLTIESALGEGTAVTVRLPAGRLRMTRAA
jgi:signal transduction histidine kinase